MQAVQDFFLGEWYFSIPLVIMSLIAAALVLWRLLLNGSAKTDMDEFLPVFQDTLRKTGIKGAIALCTRRFSPSPRSPRWSGCFSPSSR